MDEVKGDPKLKGKTNFIGWKREFERADKANDVLEYLIGEEVVPSKPKKEDYFVKITEVETRRPTKTKKTTQAVTPSTDGEEETDNAQNMISTNTTLQWQIDYSEDRNAKEKIKLTGKLLNAWVSDGIKIEIREFEDAKKAYYFIKKGHVISNERARITC